jgi:hypothetical protein
MTALPVSTVRCLLLGALAFALPASALENVTLTELPAPDGYPVAGVSNIAADGTVVGMVWPDGLVVRWVPGAPPEVIGGGLTYTIENVMPLISKDGATIVTAGYFGEEPNLQAAPETWLGGVDWAMLGGLTLGDSTPIAVSWNGQAVAGGAYPVVPPETGPWPVLPWVWTAQTTEQVQLGLLVDMFSAQVWGVSDDGTVAAGFAEQPGNETRYGVRWVGGVAQWILDADSQHVGQSIGCNNDCSVVVGAGVGPSSPQAWRWSEETGVEYLGAVVGAPVDSVYYAFESNWDGSVIVGSYAAIDPLLGPVNRGFLWTESGGMQDLIAYLAAHDIDYGNGWLDLVANAVTPDGGSVLINGMDGDYARRRAIVHIESVDDFIFNDGFEGFGPFRAQAQ